MVDSDVYLKKQWFIKSKGGKVEDSYQFDIKKVGCFLSLPYFVFYISSYWVLELMVMSLRLSKTKPMN